MLDQPLQGEYWHCVALATAVHELTVANGVHVVVHCVLAFGVHVVVLVAVVQTVWQILAWVTV